MLRDSCRLTLHHRGVQYWTKFFHIITYSFLCILQPEGEKLIQPEIEMMEVKPSPPAWAPFINDPRLNKHSSGREVRSSPPNLRFLQLAALCNVCLTRLAMAFPAYLCSHLTGAHAQVTGQQPGADVCVLTQISNDNPTFPLLRINLSQAVKVKGIWVKLLSERRVTGWGRVGAKVGIWARSFNPGRLWPLTSWCEPEASSVETDLLWRSN